MNSTGKKFIISDKQLFSLEQLKGKIKPDSFLCQIEEYNEYLFHELVRAGIFCSKPTHKNCAFN